MRARPAAASGGALVAAARLARVLRQVTSPDGVSIACEVSGEGPPVVLVHGAGSARWSFDLVRPELESAFTVIAIDRRGRGDSSDGQGYEVEREFHDVAAVVRDAGDGAMLVGHSYGGLVAAGAAQLLDGLPRLVLYEPPMGAVLTDGELIDRWERLIREGDRDPLLREFFRRVAGHSEDEIDELAGSPVWERRKQISPTLPRELRAELAFQPRPGRARAPRHADTHAARQREPRLGPALHGCVQRGDPERRAPRPRGTRTQRHHQRARVAGRRDGALPQRVAGTCSFWRAMRQDAWTGSMKNGGSR